MSFTFTSPAIATSFLKVKWREQYGSAGINKKLYGLISAGIYRGLKLSTSGSNNTVTVVPDTTNQDHLAVYETADGYSLTLRDDTNTTYSLALTDASLLNTWNVVCVFVEYKEGSTSANFVAYTLAEYEALSASLKKELIVLGSVANPTAGNPIVDIRLARRTIAKPYTPIIRNGGFEHGPAGAFPAAARFAVTNWDNISGTNGRFRLGTSNAQTGSKCLELNATATSGVEAKFSQYCEIPVVPGRGLRVTASPWHIVNSNLGTIEVEIEWGDASSDVLTTTSVVLGLTGATDSGYRSIDELYTVPTGAYFLKKVSISCVSSNFNSTGVVFRLDNAQVYLEVPTGVSESDIDAQLSGVQASSVMLRDPASFVLGDDGALLTFDKSTPVGEGTVKLERYDSSAANLMNPALALYGRLLDLGRRVLSSQDEAKLPRIDAPYSGNDDFTLLFESKRDDGGAGDGLRVYAASGGSIYITVNGYFDGTNWIKDVNGTVATALFLDTGTSAARLYSQAAAVNTWSSWAEPLLQITAAGVMTLYKLTGGYDVSSLRIGGLVLGEEIDKDAQTQIAINIIPQAKANPLQIGYNDVVGVQTIDMHGKMFTTGDLIEEDFYNDVYGKFVLQDIVGTGSLSFNAGSVCQLNTGASSGDVSILRARSSSNWVSNSSNARPYGFRTRIKPDVTSAEVRCGFWSSALGAADDDNAFTGFKIANGVVTFKWNDMTTSHSPVSTGITFAAGEWRWLSFYYDDLNGIMQWHVSVQSSSFGAENLNGGYFGGAYGTLAGEGLNTGEEGMPFIGLKTTTAGASFAVVDYVSVWSHRRGNV